MWKKRSVYIASTILFFFVFTLAIGVVRSVQPASAAILVHDENNILQNAKTAINTATTAANTAKQVALQVQSLASMSSEGILAHYLGLSDELAKLVNVTGQLQGMMQAGRSAQKAWQDSFQDVDKLLSGETSALKRYNDNQTSLRALEKTYQDSLKTAKAVGEIEARARRMKEAVTRSANAVGTKEAIQADTQLNALHAAETMHSNEILAQLTTTLAGKYAKENQDEAAAIAANRQSAEALHEHVEQSKSSQSTESALRQMYPPELWQYYQ